MKQKQILIVEDERLIADDIKMSLKNLGHAVCGMVSSGEEAIKIAEETHPDLVLMDIVLKGQMDGTEAAAIIRARFHIPILYLTAYADDKTLERAKVTEPYGYIVKPFENRELNSMIEIALYKHKIEKRLKESEEWLSTTLKSMGDAVIATDTESCVIFMNPAAQTLTGWRQEEATGRALREVFNIINENTGEPEDDPASRVLHKGKAIRLADHTILIARDGTKRHIDDSCAPIKPEKGDTAGTVLIFRDITERKMLQRELMQAEKMATIGTMAASVAHELRNPLGVIKTATYNLERNLENKDEKMERRIFNINKKIGEADKIITDLLNYSRLGKPTLAKIDINKLIEEVESRVKTEFPGTDIKTVKKLGSIPDIKVDQVQIGEVFYNIIKNAYEAIDEVGELTLSTKHIKRKNRVDIMITDTGCGISKENIEKLDQPFFSTKAKGTGLGLSLSFRIIKENHNGSIEVKSEAGKSTKFLIKLPAMVI